MSHYSFLLILLFAAPQVNAQKSRYTYLDENNLPSSKKHCLYYQELISGVDKDTSISYYCSTNNRMMLAVVDKSGNLDGQMINYFKSGKVSYESYYQKGQPYDSLHAWYESGDKHFVYYRGTASEPLSSAKLIHYWDSTGTQLIKNGSGFCRCYLPDAQGKAFNLNVGKLVNGEKDSIWTTFDPTGKLFSKKSYSKNETTNEHTFVVVEQSAQPVGGMSQFLQFVASNIRYPVKARQLGISGKVFVQFVVNEDGSISDVKPVKSVGGGCDEEAVRVVEISPNWVPGRHEGKPVKQMMTIPISFRL